VDGGAGGRVVVADEDGVGLAVVDGEAEAEGVPDGVGDAVAGSLTDGSVGGSSLTEAPGGTVTSGTGSVDSEAEGAGLSVSSTANAAGAMPFTLPVPGSTMSRRSPAGSPADVFPPDVTRTSTPSDGPTHAGSVPPRRAPVSP
jgi:hypothetical protein